MELDINAHIAGLNGVIPKCAPLIANQKKTNALSVDEQCRKFLAVGYGWYQRKIPRLLGGKATNADMPRDMLMAQQEPT